MQRRKTALITGASKGLGLAIATALSQENYHLIITGRNASNLLEAKKALQDDCEVYAISGDVRDEVHLLKLAAFIAQKNSRLDLVINNASTLGELPMPRLLDQPVDKLHTVFHTNVIAPLSLLQKLKNHFNDEVIIVNVSSDAAVGAYENWGPYGGSKAALDHMTLILGKENPQWHVYAFDPGDMRTDMHQDAFPGEDISDRPLPEESAVHALLQLINEKPASGRYSTSILKNQFA